MNRDIIYAIENKKEKYILSARFVRPSLIMNKQIHSGSSTRPNVKCKSHSNSGSGIAVVLFLYVGAAIVTAVPLLGVLTSPD